MEQSEVARGYIDYDSTLLLSILLDGRESLSNILAILLVGRKKHIEMRHCEALCRFVALAVANIKLQHCRFHILIALNSGLNPLPQSGVVPGGILNRKFVNLATLDIAIEKNNLFDTLTLTRSLHLRLNIGTHLVWRVIENRNREVTIAVECQARTRHYNSDSAEQITLPILENLLSTIVRPEAYSKWEQHQIFEEALPRSKLDKFAKATAIFNREEGGIQECQDSEKYHQHHRD